MIIHGFTLGILHQVVGWLLYPVIAALGLALLLTLWELGTALAERSLTLARLRRGEVAHFEGYAQRRLERADLLARSGPILGLMGTLIPLGPGLSALGSGNLDILATALTVAFDTTVIGLLVGLLAYLIGRVRRRWYEETWRAMTVIADGV
ncbi:MotA/TolQ/ExbB proton channel family protein [Parahaliea aestuarii]|uniref:Flagellar motor protein MotA n=1 Tax=Parahaliea aestuarii TaxID=1852021 RepID=A0A5C8ZT46_9GAMM|nr:MotA/TolQ/ExbB proton channel family protein [Parahaliea aestuarii]TXS91626.1 flagellar motor protein MotA [Parahaliea aestuarii]